MTLFSKAARRSLSRVFMNGWGIDPPTTPTTVSMRPSSSTVRCTAAATASGSLASVGMAIARRPRARAAAATVSI